MRRAWMLVGFAALALGGCQAVWGFKDFKQGSGSGGSGGNTTPCTDAKAPSGMIGVRLSDGSCVWVDKYEVTLGQYAKFLANPPANKPSECAWDSRLDEPEDNPPGAGCDSPRDLLAGAGGVDGGGAAGGAAGAGGSDAGAGAGAAGAGGTGAADPTLPVTCIDYCDALTYCVSLGKTLCKGKYNSPKSGEWYDVCSGNGANDYPYGRTHQSNYCNDSANTSGLGDLLPPGSENNCVTQDGIEDLVGNASEWVDECSDATEFASCEVRGGSYVDNATSATCTSRVSVERDYGLAQLGFRCCWSPN